NAAASERARALLGNEQSGVYAIAGRIVFLDVFLPPPELIICGAGDDARPLARFAADIGFRVVIVDRRPAYLTAERFPTAAALVESRPEELLQRLSPDAACYAVVMTHNFADDQGYLRALVGTPVPYIGMLGPRQRTERMLQILGAAAGAARGAARLRGGTLARGDGAGPRGGAPPRRARRSPVRLRHQSRLHGSHERVASQGPGAASGGHRRRGRAARRHGARDPGD